MVNAVVSALLREILALVGEATEVLEYLRGVEGSLHERMSTVECELADGPSGLGGASRRANATRRLLRGESLHATELAGLGYQVHARWHIGVVVTGVGANDVVRELRGLGEEPLHVSLDTNISVWYGSQRRSALETIERLYVSVPSSATLAIGEPGHGLDGWRLTHGQAQAALGVALHKPDRFARYTDNRLLAAALENGTLARSLQQKYLRMLNSQRDGGVKLRQTLRAHIDAGCIASSAASRLKVDRHTVEERVRTAERLLGCPLRLCLAELDVALRVEELSDSAWDTP